MSYRDLGCWVNRTRKKSKFLIAHKSIQLKYPAVVTISVPTSRNDIIICVISVVLQYFAFYSQLTMYAVDVFFIVKVRQLNFKGLRKLKEILYSMVVVFLKLYKEIKVEDGLHGFI